MFLTFNDLSAQINRIESEDDARAEINSFSDFCQTLSNTGAVDELLLPDTLFTISLYRDYNISRWINDPSVPLKQRRHLKRFLDKYRRYYNPNDSEGEFRISIDGREHHAAGCAFALEHGHTLLSLPTNEVWENRTVHGVYSSLDENGEIESSERSVDNIWTGMTESDIIAIQRDDVYTGISSGQDLWDNRKKLYPNLVFCENVKKQLFEDSEKYHIAAVMKKLDHFQEYFSHCNGPFDPKQFGLDARTESETVKNDPNLKNQRRFTLPNGDVEYFYYHISFVGKYSAGRIHFLPDNPNKRCYIGYIGNHLETKKYG